jgi:hypothetical protein
MWKFTVGAGYNKILQAKYLSTAARRERSSRRKRP